MLLMLDNYDSFTHNLVRYFAELGYPVMVRRNDQISLPEIAALPLTGLVISPGPCTPAEAGISKAAIAHLAGVVPILGVCLGHQAVAEVFGAQVSLAREVMHGKQSAVRHAGEGLFADLPQPLTVTRYHSLSVVADSLPPELLPTAWEQVAAGEQAELMALQHRDWPIFGVQFHPESVLSDSGHQLLQNFCQLLPDYQVPTNLATEILP